MRILYQCQSCNEYKPIELMYYCPSCQKLICSSPTCISKELDYYYCPCCLDSMISSDLQKYAYHCNKCYQCPKCQSQLQIKDLLGRSIKDTHYFGWYCPYCKWDSKKCDIICNSITELKQTTAERIAKIRSNINEIQIDAANCLRWELGIPKVKSVQNYTMSVKVQPYQLTKEKKEKERKEIQDLQRELVRLETQELPELPCPHSLHTKFTLKCNKCESLLTKSQIQPLFGDSSLIKGKESWLRISNLALLTIPQITAVKKTANTIDLRFYNSAIETVSSVIGTMHIEMIQPVKCTFDIEAYDEITVNNMKLAEMNKENKYIVQNGMNFVVIRIPLTSSTDIELSLHCSYNMAGKQQYNNEINCRLEM